MALKILSGIIPMAVIMGLPFILEAGVKYEKAIFAGGCFWCMQQPFEKVEGVKSVVSGYAGGSGKDPTYEDYAAKGYIEAVEVTYDPSKVSYQELLGVYWRQVDPTDPNGQFCDLGVQYRPVIFYHNEEQMRAAQNSREEMASSGLYKRPLAVEILKNTTFYKAEDYHQDYYKKNPAQYERYRSACGRDKYLKETWGNVPDPAKAKGNMTAMQYKVTQCSFTEPAFHNEYWDNHREGIYVDVASGEVLFSSKDKFDSGTGWPSFTSPVEPANIVEKSDKSLGMARTEVRSARGNSHLGHVFNDGPGPRGLRYCINSASLRFIPREDLEKEGYAKYKKLFEK